MWKKYEGSGICHTEKTGEEIKAKHGFLAPLRAKGAVFAMLTFFLYISIESTMMLWGSSYLVNTKDILPENAAGWISLFFLGITAGRMLSGFISMKLSNEALIRMGTVLIILGILLMLLPLPLPFTMVSFIIIGLGLAPIFPSMLHQTPVYFGKENAQATMGLQMAFSYSATTLMPPLFGQLFSFTSFSLMPYVLLAAAIGLIACTTRLAVLFKNHP